VDLFLAGLPPLADWLDPLGTAALPCEWIQRRRVAVNRYVEANPKIMLGKPVIRGTRITVENILERLGAGESVDDVLEAYPELTPEAIRGALAFAAEVLSGEAVYPIPDEAA
jgi:uncharacterized protein (DUF433 family)